jgi:hypothetical protein
VRQSVNFVHWLDRPAAILAETGDPARFATPRSLVKPPAATRASPRSPAAVGPAEHEETAEHPPDLTHAALRCSCRRARRLATPANDSSRADSCRKLGQVAWLASQHAPDHHHG